MAVALARATFSTSMSGNTIVGEWPPSSIMQGFMCRPANSASRLPTCTEPVNVTLRITGEAISVSEIAAASP